MIVEITPDDVLAGCRLALGLDAASNVTDVDDTLLAGLLRHCAGINCPCSRTTLQTSLADGLHHLIAHEGSLADRIDTAIEGLIMGGDLLELSEVTTDDPAVKGTWLFPAPPSFIRRPSGSVFLIGIVPDQETFLPQSLARRITCEDFTRVISPQRDENLSLELREQGLQELSDSAWLKCPKSQVANVALAAMDRHLATQAPSGAVRDLQILDPEQRVTYYRGRWTVPKNQTGNFVARRPREFGPPIWGYAALESGQLVRFLDLPLKKTRWRACDAAWHLQMAIDRCRGRPQLYRRRMAEDRVYLDFFSPLPQWAQRRLMIFGRPVTRENCLMSYQLSKTEAEVEERFLQESLWLALANDSD